VCREIQKEEVMKKGMLLVAIMLACVGVYALVLFRLDSSMHFSTPNWETILFSAETSDGHVVHAKGHYGYYGDKHCAQDRFSAAGRLVISKVRSDDLPEMAKGKYKVVSDAVAELIKDAPMPDSCKKSDVEIDTADIRFRSIE
jgi:hypothetical protein